MGFQQPTNNVRSFNNPVTNGASDNAPAAYVNIYLPKRNGQRAKLGSLKLSGNRRNDAQVMEFLQDAPDLDDALNQLKDRLVMDFVVVGGEPEEDEKLDLG